VVTGRVVPEVVTQLEKLVSALWKIRGELSDVLGGSSVVDVLSKPHFQLCLRVQSEGNEIFSTSIFLAIAGAIGAMLLGRELRQTNLYVGLVIYVAGEVMPLMESLPHLVALVEKSVQEGRCVFMSEGWQDDWPDDMPGHDNIVRVHDLREMFLKHHDRLFEPEPQPMHVAPVGQPLFPTNAAAFQEWFGEVQL
jgi:hypothetical protein